MCTKCCQKFFFSGNLRYKLIHTGPKCGKRLSESGGWKTHDRNHTVEIQKHKMWLEFLLIANVNDNDRNLSSEANAQSGAGADVDQIT